MRVQQAYQLWEGPSLLDGRPIVVIATCFVRPSSNDKTGPMVQVFIMPQAEPPHQAVKSGLDAAVCGNCLLRPLMVAQTATENELEECYVETVRGPLGVWQSWQRGNLSVLPERFPWRRYAVRFGAWGDPAAAPFRVWAPIAENCRLWTGYTHQWKRRAFQPLKRFLMASVDSWEEVEAARSLGWNTYRHGEEPFSFGGLSEVHCPYTTHDKQCIDCGLCNGRPNPKRRGLSIFAPTI